MAALGIIVMAGCSSEKEASGDSMRVSDAEIKANVEKVFGVTFDPNQDWCTTVSGEVAVTIGMSGIERVQLLALTNEVDEEGQTVTNMRVLNGAETNGASDLKLRYDAPKDNQGLYAAFISSSDYYMVKVVDNKVVLAQPAMTRALSTGFTLPTEEFTIAEIIDSYASEFGWNPGEKLYVLSDYAAQRMTPEPYSQSFTDLFRSMVFSYFKNGRKYNNLPLVKASGYYNDKVYPITTGDEPIIVSPVYKNDGGYEEVENCDLYYYYFKEEDLGSDPVAYIKSLPKYMAIPLTDVVTHGKAGDDRIEKYASFALMYFGDGAPAVGTKGTYTFPKGYKIGFMLRSKYTGKEGDKRGELYGDGRLNNQVNQKSPFSSSKLGTDGPRMAWLTVNNKMLLCCESGTDSDFNDLILEVEGGVEGIIVIPEPEYTVYTYCFEDTPLGDYDLNDIVIKAERTNETTVTYSIIACGAYDEIYVCNINSGVITDNAEVHSLFGVGSNTFINTVASLSKLNPITVTKKVDKSFSFLTESTQPFIYDQTIDHVVHLAKKGQDPHGIMIPNDFKYPLERVCIKDAYTDFNSWGQNAIISTDWYLNPTLEKVYDK